MKLRKFLGLAVTMGLFLGATVQADLKVGLVLDKGGRDDKSFNAAAYQGATKAQNDLKIQLKYVEATDDNAFEPLLRTFAQRDYDLIIGVGFAQKEAMNKIAAQFPNKHFAIVDSEINLSNVRSLMFREHEGSFLVGAIAAKTSKTGEVGFIGGMDIPLIRRFEMGFNAGVKKVNPKAKIFSNYVGVTPEAWNNPAKAKELALSQYNRGADVIFAAAGASNGGLFDAAEEKKKYAIGVDSNQNWIKPGLVLTSMLKRVDVAVFETIADAQKGTFSGGVKSFGLANDGVDYALDQYNEKLLAPDVRKVVDDLKKEIIAGKIQVPDYYVVGAHKK
jgi:basic membrane protein A